MKVNWAITRTFPILSTLLICAMSAEEYIELSHESLTKLLLLSEPETTDAEPLRKHLQEMVVNHEARILETQIAVTSAGTGGYP